MAAVAVWLVIAYPIASGPMMYGTARGWVRPGLFAFVYTPLLPVMRASGLESRWQHYNKAAWDAGVRHRLAASD